MFTKVLRAMSLREEISGYMKELLHDPNGTFTYDVSLITDKIISIIEKRIDELLKQYDDVPINKYYRVLVHEGHHRLDGKIEGIKEVKEMLK